MTFTHALATNNYGPQKLIVSANAALGTHTTIAAALAAAVSGDTVFIREGTYTENPTLKAGVNLCANEGDFENNVIILGTCTFTGAGTVSISGIQLQTNSAFALAVTGSAASVVYLNSCMINCTNNTGISYTSSSASSSITMNGCTMSLGTTGIALWASSSAGAISAFDSEFYNPGASTTPSTVSANVVFMDYCYSYCPLATSGTGFYQIHNSILDCVVINTTALTTAGTGANNTLNNVTVTSGSASSLVIGAGTLVAVTSSNFASTATNVLTGAGVLSYAYISFTGTSSGHNVTTSTAFPQLT